MKRFFRLVVAVLLLSGWGLAAASLHVIHTPGHVVVIPKDRMGFEDTYVDTSHWTLADVRAHPSVVGRLIHRGRADLLSNVVDPSRGEVRAQLVEAIEHPQAAAPPTTSPAMERVKAGMNAATQSIKQVFD